MKSFYFNTNINVKGELTNSFDKGDECLFSWVKLSVIPISKYTE